jgi:hypothetical protein
MAEWESQLGEGREAGQTAVGSQGWAPGSMTSKVFNSICELQDRKQVAVDLTW